MQFLANENVPFDVVDAVRKIGHDVAWIRTEAPGSKDRDVLHCAVIQQRILLTFDKDFGEVDGAPIAKNLTRPIRPRPASRWSARPQAAP